MANLLNFPLADLKPHPWQRNIPNIEGGDWTAFIADVRARGVREPVRVSLRTGEPVIVDGHQRVRAAREIGFETVQALTESFADEGEEITFLAGAARFRRHLTDPQRHAIGKAYREFFKPTAEEAKRDAGKRFGKGSPKVTANLPQAKHRAPTTAAKAAELVGMSETQFKKADTVAESDLEPVKEAWHADTISTHAAHELVKAPDPIRQAINAKEISVDEGLAVKRNKPLNAAVASGEKTVPEAVSLSKQMQEAHETRKRELDFDVTHKVLKALEKITELDTDEFRRAFQSGENHQLGDAVSPQLDEALNHLQAAKDGLRTIEGGHDEKIITLAN